VSQGSPADYHQRADVDRRRFLSIAAAGILAAPLVGEAQQAGRIYRIGYLSLASDVELPDQRRVAAFREGLRALGYAEGENLVIEQRYAAGGSSDSPS